MWACEREVFVNARGLHSNISFSGRGCGFCVVAVICKGFKQKTWILLLYAKVLRETFQSTAIRTGFVEIFLIYCYTQGF